MEKLSIFQQSNPTSRQHTHIDEWIGKNKTEGISPRETSDADLNPWRGEDLAAPCRGGGRQQALGGGGHRQQFPMDAGRRGNQRLGLHASPPPVMRRRENLPALYTIIPRSFVLGRDICIIYHHIISSLFRDQSWMETSVWWQGKSIRFPNSCYSLQKSKWELHCDFKAILLLVIIHHS
jgi:hypothetical protein